MKRENLKKILFAIFIFALFLRVMVVVTQEESVRIPRSDAAMYNYVGINLASGNGFSETIDGPIVPTAHRTPMFPLFLALVYSIFGHSYMAVKIIQAILGALFCIVVFFISKAIYDDERIGIISAIGMAIYKPYVSGFFGYYGGPAYLYSEYFYMFMVGLAILAVVMFLKTENKILGILTGFILGLTILTRPEFVMYPLLLGLYLFYISQFSVKKLFRKFFVMYFFIILTLTPWAIRNYVIFKEFIPFSTGGGLVFLVGNNSRANGGWAWPENYDEIINRTKDFSEYERDRALLKNGIEYLKTHPKRIPELFVRKVLVHWAPFEQGFDIFYLNYAVILLFGAIGIFFFRKRNVMETAMFFIFLSTTVTTIIIWGEPRHRYPYEPYLLIFAAVAMNRIFIIIQRKVLEYGKQKQKS